MVIMTLPVAEKIIALEALVAVLLQVESLITGLSVLLL
jgi:hypothetical protein